MHNGTLGEGRYKSSLLQSEAYLPACRRYIELNSVRAAMCQDPAEYRWSSYQANALREASALLTPSPLFATLQAIPRGRPRKSADDPHRAASANQLSF